MWSSLSTDGKGDLFIGSCSCGGYYFNGSIATIRLYDRALSPSEVRLNYEDLNPVTAGLSMLYQLNKTSGDIEQDLSGQGNNGVINGSLSYHPPLTWGEYYNVIITATINQGQEFSLDVAVRLT